VTDDWLPVDRWPEPVPVNESTWISATPLERLGYVRENCDLFLMLTSAEVALWSFAEAQTYLLEQARAMNKLGRDGAREILASLVKTR